MDIAQARLRAQRLSSAKATTAADVVRWFGAVQAQDYPGAKWALGLRMRRAADADLEQAFAAGEILRTHVLRPTWHFVAPEDIGWMLDLTAPRVRTAMRSGYRYLELDDRVLQRGAAVIARALERERFVSRAGLREALISAGINTDGNRLSFILIHAELERAICSGPRLGKQPGYALLDARASQPRRLTRDEALVTLTTRYFTSHGPARLRDFTWWSGLTVPDAKAGIAMARSRLVEETIDGVSYWFAPSLPAMSRAAARAFLLPAYDEFLVAYKDRDATLDPAILVDGRVVGRWRRTAAAGGEVITLKFFSPLRKAQEQAAVQAAERYATFIGTRTKVRCER